MYPTYQHVQWIIQQNLTHANDFAALAAACNKFGIPYTPITVIPFSSVLPDFDKSRKPIFYGSTTLSSLVITQSALKEGLFFNPETFSIDNYFARWGRHMLNYGAAITTFQDFMLQTHDLEKLFFIRPDDDTKSFSGEVKKFGDIREWYEKLKVFENTNLSLRSKIVVSQPYQIKYEWRLWIVNKKVIAASKYRQDFRLAKEQGCPQQVLHFAEDRCREYTPHDVFVMDICLCGDQLYIVECGCMNNAGFYDADIEKIVTAVSTYFSEE